MANRRQRRQGGGGRYTPPARPSAVSQWGLNEHDEAEFSEWVRERQQNLLPKVAQSEYVMSFVPETKHRSDIKFCLELGVSLMMDKPLILVDAPGVDIPARLASIADAVIHLDHPPFTEEGTAQLADRYPAAVAQLVAKGLIEDKPTLDVDEANEGTDV